MRFYVRLEILSMIMGESARKNSPRTFELTRKINLGGITIMHCAIHKCEVFLIFSAYHLSFLCES